MHDMLLKELPMVHLHNFRTKSANQFLLMIVKLRSRFNHIRLQNVKDGPVDVLLKPILIIIKSHVNNYGFTGEKNPNSL